MINQLRKIKTSKAGTISREEKGKLSEQGTREGTRKKIQGACSKI